MFICQSAPAKNSNASSWEDYIPQILTVLLEILRVYIWSLWPFVFCLSFILSVNQRFWPDSGHILRDQYGISVPESQTFLRAREVTAFSWTWFSNVLLRLLPTLSIVLANSSSATLSCTCFWIFLPSGIQWGEETDVGRQRLKWALESLFTFSELNKALDTNEYNSWRLLIFLNSTRTTNSVRLILCSLAKRQQFHT